MGNTRVNGNRFDNEITYTTQLLWIDWSYFPYFNATFIYSCLFTCKSSHGMENSESQILLWLTRNEEGQSKHDSENTVEYWGINDSWGSSFFKWRRIPQASLAFL